MGGAGFPTWRKWDAVRREPGPRVVIVNADEGEPGTIKDRYVMELRPHLLLEGLAAAMRFCETDEAYIYLREEYATSRARLARGDRRARASTSRSSSAPARTSAARRRRCSSRWRGAAGCRGCGPPFPAQTGYLGRPTLINNVETLAHVARILRGEWTPSRLWSVSGAVREPGCYEAPLDVTIRAADRRLRGRLRRRRSARSSPAAPRAGSCRRRRSTSPLTRDALREWGGGPGSAGVQVFPASYPVLRLLAETMRFFAEESCQKCTPCRIGNRALHHVVEELAARPRGDDPREGRRVAGGDGADLDLRPRPGLADSRCAASCATGPSWCEAASA